MKLDYIYKLNTTMNLICYKGYKHIVFPTIMAAWLPSNQLGQKSLSI